MFSNSAVVKIINRFYKNLIQQMHKQSYDSIYILNYIVQGQFLCRSAWTVIKNLKSTTNLPSNNLYLVFIIEADERVHFCESRAYADAKNMRFVFAKIVIESVGVFQKLYLACFYKFFHCRKLSLVFFK